MIAAVLVFALVSTCLAVPVVLPIHFNGPFQIRPVENQIPAIQVSDPGVAPVPADPVSYRPYDFGYELGNGLGMTQHRRETADGTGAVRGSYGYQDPIGVSRVVEYTADKDGYKAIVRTNEPGVVGQNPADATFVVQPPPAAAVAQGLIRRSVLIPAV